ncbi:MAG: hypothetical protein LIO37_02380 [Clostridiales bacterium]|nr:hypothetical protein [Clostridiales bacterium]
MNEFKKTVYLMMRGIQAVPSVAAGAIILLVGAALVVGETVLMNTTRWDVFGMGFGEFFMAIGMMWPMQLLLSVTMVDSVAASPAGRKLKTSTSVLASTVTALSVLALLIVLRLILAVLVPGSASAISASVLFMAIATFVLAIYSAFCYRYFVVSLVVLVLLVVPYSYTSGFSGGSAAAGEEIPVLAEFASEMYARLEVIPIPVAVVMACVIIVAGNLILYAFQILFYKVPFSKRAFGAAGRKILG